MDYYETLQISANAEPRRSTACIDSPHSVTPTTTTRAAPSGSVSRRSAEVLSDPSAGRDDVVHQQHWRERWKVVETTNGDGIFAPSRFPSDGPSCVLPRKTERRNRPLPCSIRRSSVIFASTSSFRSGS